jgi:hypothetical protein
LRLSTAASSADAPCALTRLADLIRVSAPVLRRSRMRRVPPRVRIHRALSPVAAVAVSQVGGYCRSREGTMVHFPTVRHIHLWARSGTGALPSSVVHRCGDDSRGGSRFRPAIPPGGSARRNFRHGLTAVSWDRHVHGHVSSRRARTRSTHPHERERHIGRPGTTGPVAAVRLACSGPGRAGVCGRMTAPAGLSSGGRR